MRIVFLLLCCQALLACAALRGPSELPPIPLLPPADFGHTVQLSQRVAVTLEDRRDTFLAAWVVDAERLSLAGLTPSGQRLMILSYGSDGFSEEYSSLLEHPLPGREVLSHLQLAHWPLDSIEQAFSASDWRITEDGSERRLYFRQRQVLSIARELGEDHSLPLSIRIQSQLAPYTLQVETITVVTK